MNCYSVYISALLLVVVPLIYVGECRNIIRQDRSRNILLERKYGKLMSLSSERNLIVTISESSFQEYFVEEPRNYSAFVLFNTLDFNICPECQKARKVVKFLSQSYNNMEDRLGMSLRVFFLEVLLERQSNILRRVCKAENYEDSLTDFVLNALTVIVKVGVGRNDLPTIFYFPPQGQFENIKEIDKQKYNLEDANSVLGWIELMTGIYIDLPKEEEPGFLETHLPTIGVFILTLINLLKNREFIEKNFSSVIAAAVIVITCYCTSGNIFSTIRPTPLFYYSPQEGYELIHAKSSYQYGIEPFIILLLYGGITLSFIWLIETGKDYLQGNRWKMFGSLGAFLVLFIILHSCYRKKLNYSYS